MSCYFVAQIDVRDREEYQKCLAGFDAIFSQYKGIVVAVDEDPVVLEGEWPYTRSVIIRFPNEDEARRWYESPEYGELKKHRHQHREPGKSHCSEGNAGTQRHRGMREDVEPCGSDPQERAQQEHAPAGA